jgi:hypothetical protein
MGRTLTISRRTGAATAETGEVVGKVVWLSQRRLLWNEHGTRIEADTEKGMAFELSTRYAAQVRFVS